MKMPSLILLFFQGSSRRRTRQKDNIHSTYSRYCISQKGGEEDKQKVAECGEIILRSIRKKNEEEC
jgi:hypothetical protein